MDIPVGGGLARARQVAPSVGPGPVHLDLPKDVMTAICEGPLLPAPRHKLTPFATPDHVLEGVAALLDSARRPIIYAGQGVLNCADELRALAEALHVPVTTTLHAMGCFDERHELSMHMLGMHGAAYANYAIQNADLILAIGSRFDDRTTGALAQYAPKALAAEADGTGGIVHFDIEKSQVSILALSLSLARARSLCLDLSTALTVHFLFSDLGYYMCLVRPRH